MACLMSTLITLMLFGMGITPLTFQRCLTATVETRSGTSDSVSPNLPNMQYKLCCEYKLCSISCAAELELGVSDLVTLRSTRACCQMFYTIFSVEIIVQIVALPAVAYCRVTAPWHLLMV